MWNEIVEEDEHGVVRSDRVHIVDLDHVACPIEDIVLDAVIVERDVDKVDHGIYSAGDTDGRNDTLCVKLAKSELEKQDGNAHLKNVREKVEAEDGVKDLCRGDCVIEDKRNCRAERPKQGKVSYHLVPREDREGKDQGVERAEMKREILERGIPRDEIVDDGGNSREGKDAEDDDLNFLRTAFKNKVKCDIEQKGENKTENMYDAESPPEHERSLLLYIIVDSPILYMIS